MANITLEEWLPLLGRESVNRRGTLVAIFALVSLLMLTAGYFWQKKYLSTVTLFIDESNIVRPLLEGAAVAPENSRDKAYIAKEILFSQEIMDKILTEGGWVTDDMSLPERERIKVKVMEKTKIDNINSTLLRIAFENSDPAVAYETTKRYASLFLDKTMRSQSEESNEAFQFIVTQVETYRQKLADSEKRLSEFRSRTTDARPGTENNLDARILELRRSIEGKELEYAEAKARAESLNEKLATVAKTADVDHQVNQYIKQINDLQAEMDLLRLSYTDDYPDIVRLRQQIEDLRQLANQERARRIEEQSKPVTVVVAGQTFISDHSLNPIYQQLSGEASTAQAYADAVRSRLQQMRVLLQKELNRSQMTTQVERELAELTRDYEVNKDIYQDLLRRRESARVSMTLDKERQGVLYRIQEPASFPILPSGIRFLHFAAAGLFLGMLLPVAYLVGFLQVDPRIRLASTVTEDLELPLLAVVPHLRLPGERVAWYRKKSTLTLIVFSVFLIYAAVSWLKFTQGS